MKKTQYKTDRNLGALVMLAERKRKIMPNQRKRALEWIPITGSGVIWIWVMKPPRIPERWRKELRANGFKPWPLKQMNSSINAVKVMPSAESAECRSMTGVLAIQTKTS